MIWNICFGISLFIIVATTATSFFIYFFNKKMLHSKSVIPYLSVGLFTSIWCLLFPITFQSGQQAWSEVIKSLLFSFYKTVRTFGINDFSFINNDVPSNMVLYSSYTLFLTVLCACAPILTVTYILSFFKNLRSTLKFALSQKKEYYVFSQLNDESFALAESIKRHHPKCGIVFAVGKCDFSTELEKRSGLLNAVILKKKIFDINFSYKSKNSQISFFTISDDDKENASVALKLTQTYRDRPGTRLYVFSESAESELLLSNTDSGKLKIKLIRYPKTLVLDTLYRKGNKIFSSAREEKSIKQISALIVGAGKYGQEMLKGLSWYCQMDGYDLSITSIDKDKQSFEKIYTSCPKLLDCCNSEAHGQSPATNCHVKIISGMNAETKSFFDHIKSQKPTYIFVSLGDDNLNLRVSAKIRTYCNEIGIQPYINSVLYNIEDFHNLNSITDTNGHPYQIEFIGDVKSRYSETEVISPELEKIALKIHMSFMDEEDEFWNHEHNYYSSLASAIYQRALKEQHIPGAEKEKADRTDEENEKLNQLNDRRWRAYMNTQGYTYDSSFPFQDGWSDYI